MSSNQSESTSEKVLETNPNSQKFGSTSTYTHDYTIKENEHAKINLKVNNADFEVIHESIRLCMKKLMKNNNFKIDQNQAVNCMKKLQLNQNNFLNKM